LYHCGTASEVVFDEQYFDWDRGVDVAFVAKYVDWRRG
jgi:hypothetical protein